MAKLPTTGLVFVYGTLRRGMNNNRCLGGSEFLGVAATADKLPLQVAGLPYLYNEPGQGYHVVGDVYSITDPRVMARLDQLEGHPNFYRREKIKVRLNGAEVDAFVYFIVSRPRSATLPCVADFARFCSILPYA